MINNPQPVVNAIAQDRPVEGEWVPPRGEIQGATVAGSSQSMYLCYFTADKTEVISNISIMTAGTAAGATPTLCRLGVFSVAANGDLTLVASTPNDTTLFANTYTTYTKALSASFTKIQGQRYAVGLLIVSGAAMPTFIGASAVNANVVGTMLNGAPALTARQGSLTDLPASTAVGSLATSVARIAFRLH